MQIILIIPLTHRPQDNRSETRLQPLRIRPIRTDNKLMQNNLKLIRQIFPIQKITPCVTVKINRQ